MILILWQWNDLTNSTSLSVPCISVAQKEKRKHWAYEDSFIYSIVKWYFSISVGSSPFIESNDRQYIYAFLLFFFCLLLGRHFLAPKIHMDLTYKKPINQKNGTNIIHTHMDCYAYLEVGWNYPGHTLIIQIRIHATANDVNNFF